MKKDESKKLAALLSATLVSAVSAQVVSADENPFQLSPMSSGYMVASDEEGQKSADESVKREGSVGDDKLGSGQCGEGKCGTNAKSGEGELTGSKGNNKLGSGQCGEGTCGTDQLKK